MTHRGTTNTNRRGNTRDRRARRIFLLITFGNGCTCRCAHCANLLSIETLTVDRIKPGISGGTYRRDNIRPACSDCNSSEGGKLGQRIIKAKRRVATALKEYFES